MRAGHIFIHTHTLESIIHNSICYKLTRGECTGWITYVCYGIKYQLTTKARRVIAKRRQFYKSTSESAASAWVFSLIVINWPSLSESAPRLNLISRASERRYQSYQRGLVSDRDFCLFAAVTVRYLTKRYIGEYSSSTGECQQFRICKKNCLGVKMENY